MAVKPLFGRGKQRAIDLAAQRSGRPARPVRRQQRRRQQRIAQHDAAVMVDQEDARGEGVGLGQPFAADDPAAQRLEGLHELLIGVGGAIERPAFAEQAPPAVVLGRDFETDGAGGFLRHGHARRRDPHARQRTAEAGVLQRLARGVAIAAIADQQQFEPPGPVGRRWPVDVFRCDIKSLPPALHQTVEAVAADFIALEPAVGGQPRHRGAHHAGVDVQLLEEFQQRAEPHRAAARHDGVTEYGDDDRTGARRFALQLLDDAGKRRRHASRHSAFFGSSDNGESGAFILRDARCRGSSG